MIKYSWSTNLKLKIKFIIYKKGENPFKLIKKHKKWIWIKEKNLKDEIEIEIYPEGKGSFCLQQSIKHTLYSARNFLTAYGGKHNQWVTAKSSFVSLLSSYVSLFLYNWCLNLSSCYYIQSIPLLFLCYVSLALLYTLTLVCNLIFLLLLSFISFLTSASQTKGSLLLLVLFSFFLVLLCYLQLYITYRIMIFHYTN